MKYILSFIFSLIFILDIYSQGGNQRTSSAEPGSRRGEVKVEEIYFARDDGDGKIGDIVEKFAVTDVPIYCVVQLNSSKPTTVKMNFVAVSVKGIKAETKVVSASYTTKNGQDRVNFTGKPEKVWFAGTYRVDIFLDGKQAASEIVEIGKAAPLPNEASNFQPAKAVKAARRPKKN